MAGLTGTVRFQREGSSVTYQVVGAGTLRHSLPLRRSALTFLEDGANSVQVDLRYCSYVDSTFLGDLLLVKRAAEGKPHGGFTLVSPAPEVRRLLEDMSLDLVFPIHTIEELPEAGWMDLPGNGEDQMAMKCNVVEAHQALASLEGRTGELFRPVAHCLTQALEAERAR